MDQLRPRRDAQFSDRGEGDRDRRLHRTEGTTGNHHRHQRDHERDRCHRGVRFGGLGGGDSIDPARCNLDMCGSFRLDGGWLTVRWDTGDTQRLSFTRSGEGFTLDGDTFQPARGLGAAEAVGDWVNPGGAGNPFSTGLRLLGDGTFEWKSGGGEAALRGRYQLRGLTLVLQFADGTIRPYTLFAAGRTRPAGLVSFDGSVYTRR